MSRKATPIIELPGHAGETVTISGWLSNRRSKGKNHFLLVRDGTGVVQAVIGNGDLSDEDFERAGSLPYETSLSVTGAARADSRAPGGVELQVTGLEVY